MAEQVAIRLRSIPEKDDTTVSISIGYSRFEESTSFIQRTMKTEPTNQDIRGTKNMSFFEKYNGGAVRSILWLTHHLLMKT